MKFAITGAMQAAVVVDPLQEGAPGADGLASDGFENVLVLNENPVLLDRKEFRENGL